jgi:hypothetical protein
VANCIAFRAPQHPSLRGSRRQSAGIPIATKIHIEKRGVMQGFLHCFIRFLISSGTKGKITQNEAGSKILQYCFEGIATN